MSTGTTNHHAAPIRSVKVAGVQYVAVDDLAAMFADMATFSPEAKLADTLTKLVEAMGARPRATLPPPASGPCPGCRVPVTTVPQQDKAAAPVTLNVGPAQYGRWILSATSDGWLAIPLSNVSRPASGVTRFREHACVSAATPGRPS